MLKRFNCGRQKRRPLSHAQKILFEESNKEAKQKPKATTKYFPEVPQKE
jgi:hypothetical protein